MPMGNCCCSLAATVLISLPKVRLLPPVRMEMPMPIAFLPSTSNILVGGSTDPRVILASWVSL